MRQIENNSYKAPELLQSSNIAPELAAVCTKANLEALKAKRDAWDAGVQGDEMRISGLLKIKLGYNIKQTEFDALMRVETFAKDERICQYDKFEDISNENSTQPR